MSNRYSAKSQVATELLVGDRTTIQVAKAYGIHRDTISAWKQIFLQNGSETFPQDSIVAEMSGGVLGWNGWSARRRWRSRFGKSLEHQR